MMETYSAKKLHELFVSGELSAEEVASTMLGRIDKYDGELNAFTKVFHERTLEQAQALDAKRKKGEKLGKLAGVPIAIKDNIHIKGELTTCASKMLEAYKAPFDASVVRLLEEEDALLIGKTNMDEFAMGGSGRHSAFGSTKNPWNLDYTPGGSSSGSAAAVAARLCPVSLGSDTGGSIRQPAAFTGITGFKPTYGRVSRYGIVAFGSSLDQIGPFTYNAEDAALIMEVLGQPCKRDSTSIPTPPPRFTEEIKKPIRGSKIGVPWKFLEELGGEPRKNFEESLDILRGLGVEIVDVDLEILKYGIAIYYILATAEASTNLARFDGVRYGHRSKGGGTLNEMYKLSRQEGFGWEVKKRILLGTYVLASSNVDAYYTKASRVRTLIVRQMRQVFSTCDLIALPVAPNAAFALEGKSDPLEEYLQDLYTVGANMAGLPAISTPSGFNANKMPFGLQFMGPQMHDARVLRHAHAFQQATNFIHIPNSYGGNS